MGRHTHGVDMIRFTRANDLSREDMLMIYGLLRDERLLQVFFHDCEGVSFFDFLAYAKNTDRWFYAAHDAGVLLGFGVIDKFSSSGRAAFIHTCTFKSCRGSDAVRAMREFLQFIRVNSEIESLAALLPAPYRAARALVKACGFIEVAKLPHAMRVWRGSKAKNIDGCLNILTF